MTPGGGVEAIVNGNVVRCGNEKFVLEGGELALPQAVVEKLDSFRAQGKATLVISSANRILGVIALSDTVRSEAAESIVALSKMGIRSVLLTGDNHKAAQFVAEKVGIIEVFSQLLPEDKVQQILDLQSEKHIVAMCGDGVNDAPSIKAANVGVAMGSFGSDIAIDAADIALMSDKLSLAVYLRRLAKATIRTIRTNIIISMSVNVVAIICSIYGLLNPVTGALVHNVSSLLVVINAALLYDRES
jgi:P-type E1-E2 ATPase